MTKTMLRKYLLRRDLRNGIYRVIRRKLWRNAFQDQINLLKDIVDVKVIFDVGANIGVVTQKYRSLFPEAMIHAFEPFPDTFVQLDRRFHSSDAVITNRYAVSDQDGQISLFLGRSNFTHSTLPFEHTEKTAGESISINSITMDQYCTERGISGVNILKLDIQGGEYAALKGAGSLLRNAAIDLIYAEFIITTDYQNQPNWHEVGNLLENYGYMFFNLYDFSETNTGQIRQFDAIYLSPIVRKKLLAHHGQLASGYYD